MILQVQKSLSIDVLRSVLIGDNVSENHADKITRVGSNLSLAAVLYSIDMINLNHEFVRTQGESKPYFNRGE